MIKLNEVHKVYLQGKVGFHALKDINLFFEKGETIVIYGPSGCGKTTLLNIIGGLDTPTSGDMVIDNKLTTTFIEKEWDYFRNHRIGFIFQAFNLIEHLPIVENVALSLKLAGVSDKVSKKQSIELLEKVGLGNHLSKLPTELSGGERQRVAIARALINDPDIILADEPTGALDMKTGTEIMDLIKSISKDKLVIIVTHNKKIAKKYSTRMIELVDGKVSKDTDPKDQKVHIVLKRERNKKKLKFKEAIRLAFYNIKGKLWRTMLVALGLSVGIVGLILIDSFFNSIRIGLEQQEAVLKNNPDLYILEEYNASNTIIDTVDELYDYDVFNEVLYAPLATFSITKNITTDSLLNEPVYLSGLERPQSSNILNTFTTYIGDSKLPTSKYEMAISLSQAENLLNSQVNLTDEELWDLVKNKQYLINFSYNYLPDEYSLYENITDGQCIFTGVWDKDPLNPPTDYDTFLLGPISDNVASLAKYNSNTISVGEDAELYCADYDLIDWYLDYSDPTGPGVIFTLVGIFDNNLFDEIIFHEDFIQDIEYQQEFYSEELNQDDEYLDLRERFRVFIKSSEVDNKANIIRALEEDGYFAFENTDLGFELFAGLITIFVYILQFIFSSIVSIAVITGGLMLLLILYISVIERKREIGLIRAMGGTRSDVRIIYSAETTMIGFIAGIFSVIISLILIVILNKYIYNNHLKLIMEYLPFIDPTKVLVINYSKLALAILGSIIIALISGLIPSMIAARKKPIEALRNE